LSTPNLIKKREKKRLTNEGLDHILYITVRATEEEGNTKKRTHRVRATEFPK